MNHSLPLRNKLIIMMSVMASLFLVALDQTIISTALGKIVEDFQAFESLGWVVTIYMLTTTVTVPIAGKLSDLFGRRLLLLIGVVIFGLGSFMSGAAGAIEWLIWSRGLQGIGGGIITANAFTIVGDLFAARERGKWQGLIGAVFGISSLVGPLLGGFLTEGHTLLGVTTDWRWTFFINVPVAIVAFVIIAIFCPTLRHGATSPRIDYTGAALLTVALAMVVLAVDNTEAIFANFLQTTGLSLGMLQASLVAVAAVATVGFVMVERRAREPILPLEFFRHKNYVLAISIALLFGGAFLGSIIYLTQFNQQVFGATPTQSGLMILPLVAGLMLSSIGSGQLVARTGKYKLQTIIGAGLATIGMFSFVSLTPESSYMHEALLMIAVGLGFGVMMPVINLIVQSEFSVRQLGAATSSSQLFRGLGSTIGVAVFGGLLTSGIAVQLDGVESPYLERIKESPEAQQIGNISDPNTLVLLNSPDMKAKILENAEKQLRDAPPQTQEKALVQLKREQSEFSSDVTHAFADSLHRIFIVSGCSMLVAMALLFMVRERDLATSEPSAA